MVQILSGSFVSQSSSLLISFTPTLATPLDSSGCDVTACELDTTMHSIVEEVLQKNGFLTASKTNTPVRLLKTHSNDISVTSTNEGATSDSAACVVDERFDLVVTETLDCGIFGEGIISTLHGAWEKLLKRPGEDGTSTSGKPTHPPRVIPKGVRIFARGFQSPSLRRQILCHQFESGEKKYTLSRPLVARNSVVISSGDAKDEESDVKADGGEENGDEDGNEKEPYTTIRLDDLDDISFLTDEFLLGQVAFDDEAEVTRLAQEGGHFAAANVKVTQKGTLDAIAVYFEAVLYRGGSEDEDVIISTRPLCARKHVKGEKEDNEDKDDSCWEQAIYAPLTLTTEGLRRYELIPGQGASFEFRMNDDLLRLTRVEVSDNVVGGVIRSSLLDRSESASSDEVSIETARETLAAVDALNLSEDLSRDNAAAKLVYLDSFHVLWLHSTGTIRRKFREAVIDVFHRQRASLSATDASTPMFRILEMAEGLSIVGWETACQLSSQNPAFQFEVIIVEDDESKIGAVTKFMSSLTTFAEADLSPNLSVKFCGSTEPPGTATSVDAVILDVVDKIGKIVNVDKADNSQLCFFFVSDGINSVADYNSTPCGVVRRRRRRCRCRRASSN